MANINDVKKFEGTITEDDFVRGLLMISDDESLGSIWEKCITCDKCIFEKQCQTICSTLEDLDPVKNPTCRDVINILLGDTKVEDIK